MKNRTFYSNGKLLISGEYIVLDGALALAVPTKYGQSLKIKLNNESKIIWTSYDCNDAIWYNGEFTISQNGLINTSKKDEISLRLIQILNTAKSLNPTFLNADQGYLISTHLDFPKNWGLGTSSTLINNIAQWAKINPFILLERTFGGSGYDIACAENDFPITYQIKNRTPNFTPTEFNPKFKNHLYFVYLNVKMNSRDGIKHYKENRGSLKAPLKEITAITKSMISCEDLENFSELMKNHENIISLITNQTPVKELYFSNYQGSIKSLGAWGGDFVLVTSEKDPTPYFNTKGYNTVIPYSNMVL